jgi:hypothetical protein
MLKNKKFDLNSCNAKNLYLKKKSLNTRQKKLFIKKNNNKIYLGSKKNIYNYYKLNNILSTTSFLEKKLKQIKNTAGREIFKEYKNLLNLIIIKFIIPNNFMATNIIKNFNFISLLSVLMYNNQLYSGNNNLINKNNLLSNYNNFIKNINTNIFTATLPIPNGAYEINTVEQELKFKIKEIFLSYLKLLNNKTILLTKLNNNANAVTTNISLPRSQENTGFNSLAFSGSSINSNGNNILKNNKLKFKYLGLLLSKILGKNVELQLIRLYNVGLDQNILAQTISSNSKKYKLRILLKNL